MQPERPLDSVQPAYAQPLPQSSAGVVPSPTIPGTVNPLPPEEPIPPPRRFKIAWRPITLSIAIILLLGGGIFAFVRQPNRSTPTQAGSFSTVHLPLDKLEVSSGPATSIRSLKVNGNLQLAGSLVLAPIARPDNPTAGQLYYDQTTNLLGYYNGQSFVDLTGGGPTNVSNITNVTNILGGPGGSSVPAVQLQATSPGTQQTGNFNISGTGQLGTLKTSVIDSSGSPLFVNPTAISGASLPGGVSANLGPTTIGSSTTPTGWNNVLSATKVTLGDTGGTMRSITVNFVGGSSSSHVQLAIYDDDGDIPSKPGNLLAASTIGNLVPSGLTTLTVPSIGLTANTTYWLVVNTDDPNVMRTYNGGNKSSCFISSSFGFMPDPFSPFGCFFDNSVYTIYATYITSSGSAGISKAQFSLSETGQALFQNAEDSGAAFQVQNAAGSTTVFNVDTVNSRVAIGKASAAYKLDIAGGDINLSNGRSLRFGGIQALSVNGGGTTTSISNFISGGAISAQADTFIVQDANATHHSLEIGSTGAAVFSNRINSTTAFQIQNAAGTPLLVADSSGMVLTVTGTDTAYATLTLANAHFKSTQTTAPTIGTPSNCGTTPTAAVTAGSTDSAGSFTITTGTGGTSSTCDTVLTFHQAYGATPKSILVVGQTDAASVARQIYVASANTTTFTAAFATSAGGANSTTYSFSYWVIE